jgi:hypothetical protein
MLFFFYLLVLFSLTHTVPRAIKYEWNFHLEGNFLDFFTPEVLIFSRMAHSSYYLFFNGFFLFSNNSGSRFHWQRILVDKRGKFHFRLLLWSVGITECYYEILR